MVVLTAGEATIELQLTVIMPVLRAASQEALSRSRRYRRDHATEVVVARVRAWEDKIAWGFVLAGEE